MVSAWGRPGVLVLPIGWVDVNVCAIDNGWSGFKLVVRKELRPTHLPEA